MTNDLNELTHVGPKTITLLNKLDIYSKEDLITYYPYHYDIIKKSDLTRLSNNDSIIIDGLIETSPITSFSNKSLKKISFRLNEGHYLFNVIIFNQIHLLNKLKIGTLITIIGKYNQSTNTIIANEIRIGKLNEVPTIEGKYGLTNGLSKNQLLKFIKEALANTIPFDNLPDYIIEKYKFSDKLTALNYLHFPQDIITYKKARQRLKYEELFIYLLKIQYLKNINNTQKSIPRKKYPQEMKTLIDNLPFRLTSDQNKSLEEIIEDMSSSRKMNRLLQGDVGSGKTIIALIACYYNYLSGYQSALMVPTAILARQHYETSLNLFKNTSLKVALLISNLPKKEKQDIYRRLKDKEIDLIIGTQALIQTDVTFANLGLVITDEQHRFGVNQRRNFTNKGLRPDVLSMSATPIPRTYALTIYGDMEVSNIKTKPVGRKEVKTYFKKENEIMEVLDLIKKELDSNHQIYVIAPMVEENKERNTYDVETLYQKFTLAFGKIAKIGLVHGKLDETKKNSVMQDFENNKINILISTTVIEVGVNIPNASTIVIFNANQFGLSTLHQLRGRVGRGNIQSYCILLSKEDNKNLRFLEKCTDGFAISEFDFKNRGEGELFGNRQSGENKFKLADLKKDYEMLVRAKEDVKYFTENYLYLDKYNYLRKEIEKSFNEVI